MRVLREIKRRGLRIVAVLADVNTFGGHADTEHAAVELIASGVPTYVVKEGDELQVVLGK